jgi:pantetheine-phosphate adenylyltransferase
MKIAVFPGSFDPVTVGHEAIVKRAIPLFDKIIVAIGDNSQKKYYFTLEQRQNFLKKTFEKYANVEVQVYKGLTVDFCINVNASYILRGLRSVSDFDFEKNIAQLNQQLQPTVETVFLITDAALSPVSSSIVREIHQHKGELKNLIPAAIYPIV